MAPVLKWYNNVINNDKFKCIHFNIVIFHSTRRNDLLHNALQSASKLIIIALHKLKIVMLLNRTLTFSGKSFSRASQNFHVAAVDRIFDLITIFLINEVENSKALQTSVRFLRDDIPIYLEEYSIKISCKNTVKPSISKFSDCNI